MLFWNIEAKPSPPQAPPHLPPHTDKKHLIVQQLCE